MTGTQKALRAIQDDLEEIERRSAEILSQEDMDDAADKEIRELASKKQKLIEKRSAVRILLDEDDQKSIIMDNGFDSEQRERLELRSRASLTGYLRAAISGRQVDGAERELVEACGVDGIPLELWDTPEREKRADVPTSAPGTVGVNLDRIRPAVFAHSIADKLGIEMPRVESGSYASATISTSLTADSHAKGGEAMASAAMFTTTAVTVKRISVRMGVRIEDVAAVGQANFESILRENLSLKLSDELDDQAINGAGANDDLNGILMALTDPIDPTAVVDFDGFASAHASGIDGLWSTSLKDVSVVCGPDTMRLAAKTFQSATNYKGEMSAAAYAMKETGGFWTNKRMPAAVSMIQQAILYRMGRSMMGGEGAMRTAVCPHWNEISIDDIYSGSAKGERYFTMHVLLGDVILVQPAAYAQIAYKVS